MCAKDAAMRAQDTATCAQDAATCAKDAAICAKDAAMWAKDAAICAKSAAMCANDAAMCARAATISPRPHQSCDQSRRLHRAFRRGRTKAATKSNVTAPLRRPYGAPTDRYQFDQTLHAVQCAAL